MIITLLIYVYDILVSGNNNDFISHLIAQLSQQFAIKDLGNLHHFLGVEFNPFNGGFFLSQQKYTQDLLH